VLDSGAPKRALREYMRNEARFRMVEKQDPERYRRLLVRAERESRQREGVYRQLAGLMLSSESKDAAPAPAAAPVLARKDE